MVVGHNWFAVLGASQAVKAAYLVVYTFHMPAFALVCGHFSRRFEGRPEQIRKLVLTVLVPYLVFELLYSLLSALTSPRPFQLHFSSPIYVCWFLLALFIWRLTAPFWRAVPQPVLLALLVSLTAGITVVSTSFALSRALQLLPWFVLGLKLPGSAFERLRHAPVRLVAVAAFAAAAVLAWLLAPGIDVRWFDREWSAADLHVTPVQFVGAALALDLATLVLVAAALALVPTVSAWFTALGAWTMYPFLLHGLVVRVAEHLGVHRAAAADGLLGVLALTAGAVVLALLLATPPVRLLAGWAVQPRDLWLRLRRPAPILRT